MVTISSEEGAYSGSGSGNGNSSGSGRNGDGVMISVKELVDGGVAELPRRYIVPCSERPRLVHPRDIVHPPLINLQHLLYPPSRPKTLLDIFHAARDWGFFQVVNHGVPDTVMERMWDGVGDFFQQHVDERMKYYSEDIEKPAVYVTSFNPSKDHFLNWKDSLRLRFPPSLDTLINTTFANHLPSTMREPAIEYYKHVSKVGGVLQEALSESLGLDKSFIGKHIGSENSVTNMSIHCYPPCPNPELTLGLSSHSDPNLFTLIQQKDSNIPGLHVIKDGAWVALQLFPNSFILNIGDQLQILTNGEYKSVVHRAVTNATEERVSIATFFNPGEKAMVGPLPCFNRAPPLYKETRYDQYLSYFYNHGLASKSGLDFASL